jgi:Amt family ammonium transporter
VRKFLATAAMAATSAIPALAQAQTATTLDSADSGDTAWLLAASALVLMMAAPGLTLFYGGLVRAKGFLAVMVQTGAIIAVASLLWIAAGYTLAFGPVGQWLIGAGNAWMLLNLGNVRGSYGVPKARSPCSRCASR